jgi:hypothetical protein
MLATGERRARLGDLAGHTMIVSADGEPAQSAAPAEVAPEPAEVAEGEPVVDWEPITGDPAEEAEPVVEVAEAEPVVEVAEAEPVVEVAPAGLSATPWVVEEPAPEVPAADHTLDVASPSLKELAEDVAAAKGAQPEPVVEVAPAPQPRPLAEVEIGGPEIEVDEPAVTVRSVETVSAIDLVMGTDDPAEDRPAADTPPAGA